MLFFIEIVVLGKSFAKKKIIVQKASFKSDQFSKKTIIVKIDHQ